MNKDDEIGKVIIQIDNYHIYKIVDHVHDTIGKDFIFNGWKVFNYQTKKMTTFDRSDPDNACKILDLNIPEDQLINHAEMIIKIDDLSGRVFGHYQSWVTGFNDPLFDEILR